MRHKLLLGGFCIFLSCVAIASDLKMQAEPAFTGYGPINGTLPLAVTLMNTGADARGVLRVSCGDFQMDYPIELPHGGVKRLLTYPEVNYGAEINLDLSTNQGNVHSPFQQTFPSDAQAQNILLIGDNQGDISFLRSHGNEITTRLMDCYVTPELAPDREIAYSGISAIVLGPGSERLSDPSVRALHLYILSGGTVGFLGGASSPCLSDGRWADVVPIQPKLPKTIKESSLISNLSTATTRLGGSFTIIDSIANAGAIVRIENGNIILARRDFGLGKAVFFAFNALEPPFSRWSGRRALFEKVLRPIESDRARQYVQGFQSGGDQTDPYSYGRFGSGYPYPGGTVQQDPFSTKLPPASKVFWILAAYFVVIIPINFILLKRLKRGELAWFTAPLISVSFAGIFFASAKDLYSAQLSTATQGLLIAAGNSGDGFFVGKSQLFFPQGGEYDLRMSGLDSVTNARQSYEGYRYPRQVDSSGLQDVNPVDIGRILISHMDVSNLSFREIAFEELLPAPKGLKVFLSNHQLALTNLSAYPFTQGAVIVAGKTIPLSDTLASGATIHITIPDSIEPDSLGGVQAPDYRYQPESMLATSLAAVSASTKEIVVKGVLSDFPIGPGIGKVVAERQSITLAYFTGLHFGRAQL